MDQPVRMPIEFRSAQSENSFRFTRRSLAKLFIGNSKEQRISLLFDDRLNDNINNWYYVFTDIVQRTDNEWREQFEMILRNLKTANPGDVLPSPLLESSFDDKILFVGDDLFAPRTAVVLDDNVPLEDVGGGPARRMATGRKLPGDASRSLRVRRMATTSSGCPNAE